MRVLREIVCDLRSVRAILIAGMPGSGKSLVSDVARECGLPVYVMGDVVREEILRRGLEPSPDNFRKIASDLRLEKGSDIIARLTLSRICEAGIKKDIIIIDGIRSLDELRFFKNHFKTCIILAVHASPRTRFMRLYKRGREDDPRTWSDFEARDLQELSIGIGSVIAQADIMLVNEGEDLESFRRSVREVIERITGVKCSQNS